MIYHTIFEIRYSHSNYPSEFLVQQKSTPFWSSQCHLVSWAKSYVCCVNPTYSALWFEAPVTIWYHIHDITDMNFWFIMKIKVIIYKLGWENIFRIKLYSQTLTAKYNGLTVKFETKYLLTNWFSDYQFCFY